MKARRRAAPNPARCLDRLMLGVVIGALVGCKTTTAYQGSDGQVAASYQIRKLSAELPPEVRVPAVVAAARATLLERGYSIQSADATEDTGSVSAVPPDAGLFESVEVDVKQTPQGTMVRIINEPIGNQTRSRSILDGVLAKLGR
jgi:hypothetical protein